MTGKRRAHNDCLRSNGAFMPADLCVCLTIIILCIFGWFMVNGWERRMKLDAYKSNYQEKLNALARHSTRANRIAALEAGRALAAHCREQGKSSLFDEVTLMNDLQAYGAEED